MTDQAYWERLVAALVAVFGHGAGDLEGLLAGLNKSEVRPNHGSVWTAKSLSSTLRDLYTPPVKAVYDYGAIVAGADTPQSPPPAGMKPRKTAEERQERLMSFGLRNQWYCIAASNEVGDKPVGLVRLGEKIVLWRDSNGVVHAVENRCPHRGVELSIGEVKVDHLRCAYHGVEVDAGGSVVSVPGLPGCGLEGKKLLMHFPTVEYYGAIWAYFGHEESPQSLDLPYEVTDQEWASELHYDIWPCNYRYIYDNLLDPMHGIVLHGQTYTQSEGAKSDTVKVKETATGIEVARKSQRGVNFDWVEFVDAGSAYFRVEIPLPPTAGPGSTMHISFFATPVDDENTRVTVFRSRNVSGWKRDLWHFLYKYKLCALFDAVLAQDWMVANAMPPWPATETLYQHDIGLARLRRRIESAAKKQSHELGLGDY